MKKLFLVVLMCFSGIVAAKDLFRVKTQVGYVYFTDQQVKHTGEKCPDGWFAGRLVYSDNKKVLGLCYTGHPRGLFILDDEGDQGLVPINLVEEIPGA